MDKQKQPEDNFPHVMRWPRFGKKGERCQIIRNNGNYAHIRFEDGLEGIVSREALRRAKTPQRPNPAEEAAHE